MGNTCSRKAEQGGEKKERWKDGFERWFSDGGDWVNRYKYFSLPCWTDYHGLVLLKCRSMERTASDVPAWESHPNQATTHSLPPLPAAAAAPIERKRERERAP
jgi:hypothetical protein